MPRRDAPTNTQGLECHGSPGRSIDRTFHIVFYIPNLKGKLKITIIKKVKLNENNLAYSTSPVNRL